MIKEYINNPAKIAADVKTLVLSGEVDPIMVKVMFDIFSEAMNDKEVKGAIMAEVDKHPKQFEVNGFRFEKASRSTYSFKHDAEWLRLDAQRKSRENLMKLALEQDIADPNTGEIVPPAIKSSTEFIKKAR